MYRVTVKEDKEMKLCCVICVTCGTMLSVSKNNESVYKFLECCVTLKCSVVATRCYPMSILLLLKNYTSMMKQKVEEQHVN